MLHLDNQLTPQQWQNACNTMDLYQYPSYHNNSRNMHEHTPLYND